MAIKRKPTRYESGLGRSLGRYQTMMSEMQQAKASAQVPIASEYGEMAEIYRTGGEYGAGGKARVRETAAANLAKTSAGLVATGMSSGSLAASTQARYGREVTRGIQEVEDVRYERLGAALQAVASAKEARGIRVQQAFTQTAQMAGQFQEPAVGQFESSAEIAAMQAQTQKTLASKAREETAKEREFKLQLQRGEQRYQTTERKATEKFAAGQAARYTPTAAAKSRLDTLKTFIK